MYTKKIVWMRFNWGKRVWERHVVTTQGPVSLQVWYEAVKTAKAAGWTPIRWWQWWRFADTKVPPEFHSC